MPIMIRLMYAVRIKNLILSTFYFQILLSSIQSRGNLYVFKFHYVCMFICNLTFENVRFENKMSRLFGYLLNGCFVLLIFCVLIFGRAPCPFPGTQFFWLRTRNSKREKGVSKDLFYISLVKTRFFRFYIFFS